jgi:hypothetical protein
MATASLVGLRFCSARRLPQVDRKRQPWIEIPMVEVNQGIPLMIHEYDPGLREAGG